MKDYSDLPRSVSRRFRPMVKAVPSPDPGKIRYARQAFLAEAQQFKQHPAHFLSFATGWFFSQQRVGLNGKEGQVMLKFARVVLTLVILSGATAGAAFAADASGPGDFLYPVDLMMEQVQSQFAFTEQAQAQLQFRIATERMLEFANQVRAGQDLDNNLQAQLQVQARNALQSAGELDTPVMARELEKLRTMAQEQERLMEQAQLEECQQLMQQVQTKAQLGMDDPAAFRNQVRHGAPGDDDLLSATQQDDTDDRPIQDRDQIQGGEDADPDQDPDQDRIQDRGENCTPDCDGEPDQDQDQVQDQGDNCTSDCDGEPDQDQDQDQNHGEDCIPDCDGEPDQDRDQDRDQTGRP